MINIIDKICDIVWGKWTLLFLLSFGLYITVKSRFFQIRKAGWIFRNTIGSLFSEKNKKTGENEISQKGAFCSALAATMGTGNIIGVASAVSIGGAGAVFWMWVSAFIGMMIVYAENYFGTIYRIRNKNGQWSGGAMNYIAAGTGKKVFAVIYAVLSVCASFGMGNMVQTNSIADALYSEYSVPTAITGAAAAFLCGLVILGGIKRISKTTEIIIPLISAAYIIAALAVIIKNRNVLPDTVKLIFSEAFGIRQAAGGISGALIKKAMTTGLKRGVFSNEAGLGTSAMIHTSGNCCDPKTQGIWGIAEVFADTIVCCTITAFMVIGYRIKSGDCISGGNMLVINSFESCLNKFSGGFVCICIAVFAFATLIGWSHCGESAFCYITKNKYRLLYRFFYCLLAYTGAVMKLETVWTVSDIFNGLMMLPNISALFILCRKNNLNTH